MEPIQDHNTEGDERGKGRLGGGDGWQRGCEGEYPGTIIQRIILVNLSECSNRSRCYNSQFSGEDE